MHHKNKWHFAKLQTKKKPLYRVPAFNNHQIKSELHTSTRRENIRQGQPLNGKQATHVPDICLWAVGCSGLFPGLVGGLINTGRGKSLGNISLF